MKILDFILDDSRRLTGPNLLWEKPGAIIDVIVPLAMREVLINTWQTHVKKLLDEIGLDGDRVEMVNISAAMGSKFANTATEMTSRIDGLGPNPLKKPVTIHD